MSPPGIPWLRERYRKQGCRSLTFTPCSIATAMTLSQVFHADCFSSSCFSLVPVWLESAAVKSLASCALRIDIHHHTDLGKKVRLPDTQICFPDVSLFDLMNITDFLLTLTHLCSLLLIFDLYFSLKRRFQMKPKLIFSLSYVPFRRVLEDSVFKLMKRSM